MHGMDNVPSSPRRTDPAIDPGSGAGAAAGRTARDRHRAEREVCRALSEGRAVAIWIAFIAFSHLAGFALLAGNGRLLLVAGALALGFFMALVAHVEPVPQRGPKGEIAKLSEPEFERLLESVEREAGAVAASGGRTTPVADDGLDRDGFACLVAEAIDDLPAFLQAELEHSVPVVISDDGSSHGAYGLYMGATVAHLGWGSRIVIFRDTLTRDFGDDPDTLRRLVTMVVRHEMAHHLGASERDVSDLGLYDLRGSRPAKPLNPMIASRPRSHSSLTISAARREPASGPPRPAAPARRPGAGERRLLRSSTHTGAASLVRLTCTGWRPRDAPHPARPPPPELRPRQPLIAPPSELGSPMAVGG